MKSVQVATVLLVLGLVPLLTGCGQQVSEESLPAPNQSGAGDSSLSEADIVGIQDACLQVFNLDWENVTIENMKELANEYTTIKNGTVRFGDVAQTEIEKVADLVIQMDETYDWMESEARSTFDSDDLETTISEGERIDKEFRAKKSSISENISQVCQPHFE